MTDAMGWAANLDGSYDSTLWSMSSEGCDQCKNTDMKPQCALPKACGKGVQVFMCVFLVRLHACVSSGILIRALDCQ